MTEMSKIIITKGLPASGKSTFSRQKVEESCGRMVRVNKDEIRSMLGEELIESLVVNIRDSVIKNALDKGFDVIVDDTNLNPIHEISIREKFGHVADVEVVYFDVPLEVCLHRNALRANPVPENFICSQYKKYIDGKDWKWSHLPLPLHLATPDKTLPKAIIVDIDGTIARAEHRDIYDLTRVLTDEVIQPTKTLVDSMRATHKIIFLSGRYDTCRIDTERWLQQNNINYDELFMRMAGDSRKDYIIKNEMYKNLIEPKYNVEFVMDDRKQIKRMWNKIGLFIFDVNQTDEEF